VQPDSFPNLFAGESEPSKPEHRPVFGRTFGEEQLPHRLGLRVFAWPRLHAGHTNHEIIDWDFLLGLGSCLTSSIVEAAECHTSQKGSKVDGVRESPPVFPEAIDQAGPCGLHDIVRIESAAHPAWQSPSNHAPKEWFVVAVQLLRSRFVARAKPLKQKIDR
jgi:hypothetical protein